ncbi:MAG TPA: FtsX-like permease family protein, partial [Thermopetrobacter sp.]|nr:FtsX-like permease family protein [Thermopetrobacter sp.]
RLRGIDNDKLKGSLDGFDAGEGLAVGWRLAWKHGVGVGDSLTLISPEGEETPFGVTPRIRSYPVRATFEVGMSLIDSSLVYMPLKAAQDYFNMERGVTGIEIMLADPQQVDAAVARIRDVLPPGLTMVTWKRANQTFFNALAVERNVMFIILALIILVAALNIISGLIMLVKDKGGDIAILRTMGAARGAVLRIFFMTGAAIGVAGTLAGTVLGVVFSLNVENIRRFLEWLTGANLFPAELYYLSRLPADLDVLQTAGIAVFALALSFLATIYPAWRAASLDPVEALRHE